MYPVYHSLQDLQALGYATETRDEHLPCIQKDRGGLYLYLSAMNEILNMKRF